MGLGALLTRNISYVATNTVTGESDTFTMITDGGPGMFPDWSYGAYRGLLGIPVADRAMTLAASLLSRVPWDAYRKVAGRRPVKLDPNPTILDAPAGSFEIPLRTWFGWAMDRMAHGNGVGLVASRGPDGWPTSYLPVDAEFCQVRRAGGADTPRGFGLGEIVWGINGREYHASDVIHFKGPSKPGALRGMGILENHFATMDRTRKLDSQAGAADASAVPTGLLKSLNPDLTQAEANAMKDAWRLAQATRTVAVLNPSTEFEPIAWNPTEAQLIEARKYTIVEWSNIFGIDLAFLGGDSTTGTYSNIEQKGIDLLRYGRPGDLIAEWEQTLTMAIPRGQLVKANLDFTLRADTKTRYEAHAIALASGFLTADEVRELEDRDPLTDQQREQIAAVKAPLPAGPAGQAAGRPSPPRPLASNGQQARLTAEVEVLDVRQLNADQPRLPDGRWGSGAGGPGAGGSHRRWDAGELAQHYRSQVMGSTTPAERRAVSNYAGGEFVGMNDLLRRGPDDGNDWAAPQVQAMNELMGRYRTPGATRAVRAVHPDPSIPPSGQAVGKVITSAGFQSTSVGDVTAPLFDRYPLVMSIDVPPGSHAIVVNGTGRGKADENELVLPHGTRYAVTGDEQRGAQRWLNVTALPPE